MSSSKSSMSCLNPHCPSSSSAGSESKIISGKIDLRNIHQCSISKTAKLKKRKTKKQRDEARCKKLQVENAKKGSNGIFSQIQGLQHSLRVPPSSAFKVTYNSNPVIITKSRLSQHLGMFNREVKSIDIERLLSKANEKDIAENDCQNNTSQIEKENTVQGDNIHTHLCAADTEVNVNEEVAFLNCKEQNLLRDREHVNNVLLSEERQNSTPGSQGTDIHPITIFLHSDKESHMPSSSRMNVPVLEVAEKIFRKLHNQVLFPGRNLVSETQKSIMAKRVQMKKISLITSAQKKLDCSTKG
ncbi:uncharacterized protein LOC128638126 [Bombina bombina]|uniref:uncharacterized protein LOC128638126 n=1 Tax=Bombina bombina TaxID=8345 RepID=UPI00235AA7E6|nr:uncharacterized protein LOC128638126 [Bombina bombina]